MKKVIITICMLASIFVATAQTVALPKENLKNMADARAILVNKTSLPLETITRTCYVLESLETKKVTVQNQLKNKPAELAKALAELSALKLNNIKGIVPQAIFSQFTKEDIAVLIQ